MQIIQLLEKLLFGRFYGTILFFNMPAEKYLPHFGGEEKLFIEEMKITPNLLQKDNQTSRRQVDLYNEAKKARELFAIEVCSDARVAPAYFFANPCIVTNSISAGGEKSHLGHAFNHKAVQSIIVATHFAGDSLISGEAPTGCGGLGAKANPEKHTAEGIEDVLDYVERRLDHRDPLIQSYHAAVRISKNTDKPIMAASIDHLTGRVYPIALFTKRGRCVKSVIGQYEIIHYNPKQVYKDEKFPSLETSSLPDIFQKLIRNNRRQIAKIRQDDPNFTKKQKVQNPLLVTLTTSVIPQSTRLKKTCGVPNTSFEIHLGYLKNNGKVIDVDRDQLEDSIKQLQYPLINALAAKSRDDNFGRTETILIETPGMGWSEEIAKKVIRYNNVKRWLEKNSQNQILIAEFESGMYTQEIQKFR